MMRQILTVVTILTSSLACLSAHANDWDEFWARYHLDVKRNEAWPQPFLPREQCAVRQPFGMMVLQGWQEQNTLTEHHFDPETHRLNRAGLFKIQSVLQNSPPAHRSIFVYSGYDDAANQARIGNVRETIAQWIPAEAAPEIVATPQRPYSLPGMRADAITRRFQESMPTPTIPVTKSSNFSGGTNN